MNNIKGYDKFFSKIDEKFYPNTPEDLNKELDKVSPKADPECKKIISSFKSIGEVTCSIDKNKKHSVTIKAGENSCNIGKFNKIVSKIAEVCKANKFKDGVNDVKISCKEGKVTFFLIPKA